MRSAASVLRVFAGWDLGERPVTASDEVLAVALSILQRLRVAEQQCRDRYVDPHREAATLPVVLSLAEVVAGLAALVAAQEEQPCAPKGGLRATESYEITGWVQSTAEDTKEEQA